MTSEEVADAICEIILEIHGSEGEEPYETLGLFFDRHPGLAAHVRHLRRDS